MILVFKLEVFNVSASGFFTGIFIQNIKNLVPGTQNLADRQKVMRRVLPGSPGISTGGGGGGQRTPLVIKRRTSFTFANEKATKTRKKSLLFRMKSHKWLQPIIHTNLQTVNPRHLLALRKSTAVRQDLSTVQQLLVRQTANLAVLRHHDHPRRFIQSPVIYIQSARLSIPGNYQLKDQVLSCSIANSRQLPWSFDELC